MRRDRHERRRENERESEKKTQRNDAHSQQTPVINYWNGAVLQQADSDLKQIKHFETGNNNTHQMIIIVIMNKIEIRTERNTGKRKQWDFTKLGKENISIKLPQSVLFPLSLKRVLKLNEVHYLYTIQCFFIDFCSVLLKKQQQQIIENCTVIAFQTICTQTMRVHSCTVVTCGIADQRHEVSELIVGVTNRIPSII